MKKTWRFQSLTAQARDVMPSAPSLEAAAKALGVDKSTVFRWVKAGKIPPPGGRRRGPMPVVPLDVPAADWAESIRAMYSLSRTDAELVNLAADALALARDPTVRVADRLAASSRFARLVVQLNLEVPLNGEAETPTRPAWPRRVG